MSTCARSPAVVSPAYRKKHESVPPILSNSLAKHRFLPRDPRSPAKPPDLHPLIPAAVLPVRTGVTRAVGADRAATPLPTTSVRTRLQGCFRKTARQQRGAMHAHLGHAAGVSSSVRPTFQESDLRDRPEHPPWSRSVFRIRLSYIWLLRGHAVRLLATGCAGEATNSGTATRSAAVPVFGRPSILQLRVRSTLSDRCFTRCRSSYCGGTNQCSTV
jgi:hypothetical protein